MPLWPDLKLHPNLMDLLISHNFRQEALSWPSSITYTIKYVFSFHVFSPCYNTNSWSCISYWLCSQSQLWLSFQNDSFWNAYPFLLRHKLSLRDESWKNSDKSLSLMMEGCAPKIQYSFLAFGTCTTLCYNFQKNFRRKRRYNGSSASI